MALLTSVAGLPVATTGRLPGVRAGTAAAPTYNTGLSAREYANDIGNQTYPAGQFFSDPSGIAEYSIILDPTGQEANIFINPLSGDVTVQTDQIGEEGVTVSVAVTLRNSLGSASGSFNLVVLEKPPENIVLPSLSAPSTNVGEVVTLDPGEWIGVNITLSFAWKLDGVTQAETGTTYTLPNSVGSVVTAVVTATNTGGSVSATTSNSITITSTTAAVAPDIDQAALVDRVHPADGTARSYNIGSRTTGTDPKTFGIFAQVADPAVILDQADGTYGLGVIRCGEPDPTLTYQWKINGANVAGATGALFDNNVHGVTGNLTCVVTATNKHTAHSRETAALAI